jgi:ribose/xylose/arabinose/galactoside ABC-type transport system permease subunit
MHEKQLIQKIWGEKRVFTIKDDHIHFQKKTLKENVEYTVKFEEVSFQMVKKVERTANFVLYIYIILTLGAVYGLVNGFIEHAPLPELICWSLGIMFFGFFCLSLYRLRNWETIYISAGSKPLNLMATKPDRQTVLTFIDTIHLMRK